MVGRLRAEQLIQLNKWIGDPFSYTLIYSLKKDGRTASEFHKHCDKKSPTVTVIYDKNQNTYGGVTFEEFRSTTEFITDPHAFLFWLKKNGKTNLHIFRHANNGYRALFNDPNYGPTFGGAKDLRTFRNEAKKENSEDFFKLNDACWFGNHYSTGIDGKQFRSIYNETRLVEDIEVYHLERSSTVDTKISELRTFIYNYKPEKLEHVNVLFVGLVGAGKSSLINTIYSFYNEHRVNAANCGPHDNSSMTKMFKVYSARERGKTSNIQMCDIRGIDKNLDLKVFDYIIDGNIPDGYQMPDAIPEPTEIKNYIADPLERDQMHCVCIVINGNTFKALSDDDIRNLKTIRQKAGDKNIPVMAVVTHIDVIFDQTEEIMEIVLDDREVEQKILKPISKMIGIQLPFVFPMICPLTECISTAEQLLTATLIRKLLRSCDDGMLGKHDASA